MSEHAELRRLAEAATPGPWKHESQKDESGSYQTVQWVMAGDPEWAHVLVAEDHATVLHGPHVEIPAEANAAYIAAANPATILSLLDEIDRLRAFEAGVHLSGQRP